MLIENNSGFCRSHFLLTTFSHNKNCEIPTLVGSFYVLNCVSFLLFNLFHAKFSGPADAQTQSSKFLTYKKVTDFPSIYLRYFNECMRGRKPFKVLRTNDFKTPIRNINCV